MQVAARQQRLQRVATSAKHFFESLNRAAKFGQIETVDRQKF
jgi:hypothetical protein